MAAAAAVLGASVTASSLATPAAVSASAPTVTGAFVDGVTSSGADVRAAVNPNGSATTYVVQYGTTASYGQQTPSAPAGSGTSPQDETATIVGLTPLTTYHFRFVATSAAGTTDGPDGTFTTLSPPPNVTGEGVDGVTTTSAVVHATVTPNGSATTYVVQYGPTTGYGQETSPASAGSGTSGQTVSATLAGLDPGTTYHFRFVATNESGAMAAPDVTFTTAPVPPSAPSVGGSASGGVTSVTTDSAVVQATIATNGSPTSYLVQYGTTTSYGQQTTPASAASASGPQTVTATLTGLASGTTYHYRFVATNALGTTDGPDGTFTTSSPSPSPSPAPSPTPTPTPSAAPFVPPSPGGTPVVSAERVATVTGTDATLIATVDTGGTATAVSVEYGATSAYGKKSAPVTVQPSPAPSVATIALSGLSPSTVYHFRFVATNPAGAANGTDESFVTTTGGIGPTLNPNGAVKIPPPVQGLAANIFPYSGKTSVSGKPLLIAERIRFGTVVDATNGIVTIRTVIDGVVQKMEFYGAKFLLTQAHDGTTVLGLEGGTPPRSCTAPKTTKKGTRRIQVAENAHTLRALWGNGHGKFRIKGKYAAATVRGTWFHVVDRCDGTLVHVKRGIVAVLNVKTGKTVFVIAGQSYLVLTSGVGKHS